MDSPQAVVHEFIHDYFRWNLAALQLELDDPDGGLARAEKLYQILLDKFCEPGFVGEPIAFGSDSSHDPSREKIVLEEISGDHAVIKHAAIKTTQQDEHGFVIDYEYRLMLRQRWFLLAVDYVDADGSYPSL
jgi:hypothetical protein